jgi:arylsulfatase A-like enzyme
MVSEAPGSFAVRGWAAVGPSSLIATALVLVLACDRGPHRREDTPPRRPHVVLVVVDTLRADALGFAGSPHGTPNLDRLARESVVFRTAIAPSTWTVPSVASLLTSLYPSELGVFGNGGSSADGHAADSPQMTPKVLAPELFTLAEAFQAEGYRTVGIVNQVFMPLASGFGQGFDIYASRDRWNANALNDRLEGELDASIEAGIENGLFLYVHYFDPHWPYTSRRPEDLAAAPASFAAADDDAVDPPRPGNRAQDWLEGLADEESRRRALDTLAARYALEVRLVDAAIGRLIATLEGRGLWNDTILVVTADHGEGFWEHERLLHGQSPHEEQVRIPLIVRIPPSLDFPTGERTAPVGLIDVMPTLLDLAGLRVPEQSRGRSLVPALRGEEDEQRALLIETGWERALRTRDSKLLVRGVGVGHARDSEAADDVGFEFFDLVADPGERQNLATPCEGRCRESVRRLQEIERDLVPRAAAASKATTTPDEMEQLRSLGYVDD